MDKSSEKSIIQYIYNKTFRPYLPYKISVHNGVAVLDYSKLFDLRDTFPEYEGPLVSAIRSETNSGDDVIVIGGGIGVSTVAAAEATGRRGNIKTYEASATQYTTIQNTIELNKVKKCIEVNHTIVGSFSDQSSESYGDARNAEKINPTSLPESDILVLDCEGTEIEILTGLQHTPRAIIVETHAFADAPEQEVRDILSKKNYNITNREVEVESRGIFVLTAVQQ